MIKEQSKEKFLNALLQNAGKHPEFKEELIKNPKQTIESKLNFKLPDDFEIMVFQDSPNKYNLVLPWDTNEISELELASISGGVCWSDSCRDFTEF